MKKLFIWFKRIIVGILLLIAALIVYTIIITQQLTVEQKAQAEKERIEYRQANKDKITKKLVAELKTIPTSEFSKNKDRYEQLLELYPTNKKYQSKIAFYSKKIADAEALVNKKLARIKRIRSQFSGYDGSHSHLEKYVKSTMHNPDSYEHVKTVYWDKGDYLIVQTIIRGTNAFGGTVSQTVKVKVSLEGQLLEIIN